MKPKTTKRKPPPKGEWFKQLAKATEAYLPSISNTLTVKSLWKDAMRKKNAAKSKPFVVYMWTAWNPAQRSSHYAGNTDKRRAEAARTNQLQVGLSVGPLTRVELPRPVKVKR